MVLTLLTFLYFCLSHLHLIKFELWRGKNHSRTVVNWYYCGQLNRILPGLADV